MQFDVVWVPIIVAIITGGLSLAGVIVTVNGSAKKTQSVMETKLDRQQAVMEVKLNEVTRQVREQGKNTDRIPVIAEQIKVINHRLDDLEAVTEHLRSHHENKKD